MFGVIVAPSESDGPRVGAHASLVREVAGGLLPEGFVAVASSEDVAAEVAELAGCRLLVSPASTGGRLRAAAATARAPWLMFLRPGVVVDSTWMDDVARFMENGGDRGAAFRPGYAAGRPVLLEALSLLRLAVGGLQGAGLGRPVPPDPLRCVAGTRTRSE